MSEQIDVDANNLCITEEVFEKFQAESMYEEEELITLSDILPSNGTEAPKAPDDVNDLLADENAQLCDIPNVNSSTDIVSENVHNFEITTALDAEIGDHEQHLLEASDINVSENVEVHTEKVEERQPLENVEVHTEKVEDRQPKRRGRQRKNPIQESLLDNAKTEQPAISQPRRRGRRKKIYNDSIYDTSIEEQMELIHEGNPVIISNDEPIQKEQTVAENTMLPIPKRRGRKKKVVQESKVDTSIEDKIDDVGEVSEQLDINIDNQNGQNNGAPARRRGRKKKTILNSSVDTALENSKLNNINEAELSEDKMDMSDDLPISQMRSIKNNQGLVDLPESNLLPESTNIPKIGSPVDSNKTVNYDEIDSVKQNVSGVKKRGRPRRRSQKTSVPDLSQSLENKNDIDSSTHKVEEPSSTVDKPDSIVEPVTTNDINESSLINDNYDEADDMCLSNLKQVLVSQDGDIPNLKEDVITSTMELEVENESKKNESLTKRNSKAPVLPDFEYNLDNITNEDKVKETAGAETKADGDVEDLLVEDTSKRPKRRKTKQNFHYQEDSDEDPFANVELSDDEPKRGKKYYSDDEYIPGKGKKRGKAYTSESSQSSELEEIDEELEGVGKQKRKRYSKKIDSPKKKSKINDNESTSAVDITTIPPASTNNTDDIEVCLESSVINKTSVNPQTENSSENKSTTWGHTNAFENFIAQKIQGTDLKIKKVSSTASTTAIAPLDIPILDPNAKKMVEKSAQTSTVHKNAQGTQTSPPYDIPMKDNVPLTTEQSDKACEFLNSIVKTTSELGVLMTQKSEDFMKKKIHTNHVTDTFKMDYCVRKSFLLFKLAKHNLMQMEEDLAKQYEEFLKTNNLHTHREKIKTIASTSARKGEDNDSDCEIVDVKPGAGKSAATRTKNEKPKFNPKTVFLNKELSIKIAKKTPEEKTPNIKGRHTVWINDSVILKKVTPTQSFLAQDSRNKKPPDHCKTIEKIVYNFFREYDRQKAMSVCAPFISTEWITVARRYACNYFVASPEIPTGSEHFVNSPDSESVTENKTISEVKCVSVISFSSPKSLFSLCTLCIQKQSFSKRSTNSEKNKSQEKSPHALFKLCLHSLNKDNKLFVPSRALKFTNAMSLKTICHKKVMKLTSLTNNQPNKFVPSKSLKFTNAMSLKTICHKKVLELISLTKKQRNLISLIPEKKIISIEETTQVMPKILQSERKNAKGQIKNGVKKLFSICVEFIQENQKIITQDDTLSIQNIHDDEDILYQDDTSSINDIQNYDKKTEDEISDEHFVIYQDTSKASYLPRSLKNITYSKILHLMYSCNSNLKECKCIEPTSSIIEVKTLSKICLDIIQANLYGMNVTKSTDMTINSVNTLSEEAFFNIEGTCTIESNQYQYFDEEDANQYEDDFEPEYELEDNAEETAQQDNNWVTQVQMKEFKSCLVSNMPTTADEPTHEEPIEPQNNTPSAIPCMVNIKSEPLEDELVPQDNMIDPVNVKTEPTQVFNEFTISLEDVTTKTEPDHSNTPVNPPQRKNSAIYDSDAFESFVRSNKMMRAVDNSEEVFSQSALRVRRQFDPDSDDENDAGMSLLVPHTYEPLQITEAKDNLMQSSSDESNKDVASKKKLDKKKKRGKKVEPKVNNKEVNIAPKNKYNKIEMVNNELNKEVTNGAKNKTGRAEIVINEVAMLTRRMRGRIRQEEKKVQSSDSENETRETRSKSDKKKGRTEDVSDNSKKPQKNKYNDTDIQCNNVDSTEQIDVGDKTSKQSESIPDEIFTGFSTIDQNEITTYQKYLKDVYDKIIPKIDDRNGSMHGEPSDNEPLMDADEPVELLECEPTLPIFEREPRKRTRRAAKAAKAVPEEVVTDKGVIPGKVIPDKLETETDIQEKTIPKSQLLEKKPAKQKSATESVPFVDRHGWQCYPIDVNDKKLYDNCHIPLDKLPETFVEMYFQYQDITGRTKEDEEVDRLTNLQSLHGKTSTVKELKSRTKANKEKTGQSSDVRVKVENDDSRPNSPGSEHYHELTPSEDEGSEREEEAPPPVAKPPSENNMAKSSLMDDQSDSDTENAGGKLKKVKQEPVDEASPAEKAVEAPKRRPGPKSKTKPVEQKPTEPPKPGEHPDLMLTADKMMNKELTLLHAPINLEEKLPEVSAKKPPSKGKQKKDSSKKQIHYRIKNEDDSSSEEEKQWVTTKEKLLKRLEKKQDTTIADEAKRTKIVSEYIERRGENAEPRLTTRRRGRRSNKRFLERQKQLRVLTRELLGDAADSPHHTKRFNQSYFKGRRNIRKVIDKKSLAKSTVVANMEEFERKRRLNMKQARLREILGCEEGVNVLVINDELCLEYDFEQQQPVVSVHPFFTKIMKAHQYEGVKFMWDACFESLSQLASGHPGGGCILAHCMGLGKTLQVLALLHTVLTHPGAGMQRVLVCCPLSTVLNWVDEIHKWIGPVTDQIKVFELSKLKKTYERAYQLEDWYSGGGIFIIGYELFRSLTTLDAYLDDVRPTIVKKIRTALLDPGPDIVVCDEGHLLKNDCSVLAVAMSRVVTRRRIVLTGTPMQNNLREYFCMVNFVKPNLLGTYSEYSNRFENPIMNGQHRDSSEEDIKLMKARTHILHKVLEGCLQRQEASVLYPYLPKKHEYTVFISLTKCQWDMYKYYLTHYANKAKHGVLKDFHMLQKIWSHPQVLHHFQTKARDANANKLKTEKLEDDLAEEEAATEDVKPGDTDIWWLQFLEGGTMLDSLESSNKFVVVFRILDECIKLGDKVLIFSTSLFTMDALEFFLRKINKWSLGQEYYRLDGSVPAEVRQKWCREFNAEHNLKTKLFLISTRAGSLGLNMVAANRVIILDTSWNPAHDIQSIFRVYRFGQKKDCYIYRLVALGTMEQKIYERSVTKQAVACRVVDEQQIDRHYNMQELTELYRFDESGSGVESGVAAGVRDVALLRVARLRALHAVHEHDSLLRGSEPALPEHERQAAWSQFQQEHENGQLETKEKVKKIAVKRTYNKATPATAIKLEPGAPGDAQDLKAQPPKAKRGRKSANAEQFEGESILPDPDTEKITTLDPDTEQLMVKKITEILVRYNFSYKDAQSAFSQLVMNVRRIVMSGQGLARCDKLTAEIAAVLMQRQDNMSMPLVNGIIGESINQTMLDNGVIKMEPPAMPPLVPTSMTTAKGRPKKAKPAPGCRKGYVYEEIPSTSTAPDNIPLFDRLLLPNDSTRPTASRTKRKAALAAEKLLDTAVEDGVIDLDNDADYYSETDSAPESRKQDDKTLTKKNKTKQDSNKPDITIAENSQSVSKEVKAKKSRQPKVVDPSELEVLEDVIDTSILLSDDDDAGLSQTAVELEPEGEISVHPSLLKNSNFIKIVAHTYLAGNPMLDEDAAMLAARYSTYKAVKELETTGKPITSGPIYDIAVQVLGKPILKKLHNTNHKVDTADDDAQSSLLLDLLSGNMLDKGDKQQPQTSEKAKAPEKAPAKATKAAKAPEPPQNEPEKPQKAKKPGRRRKIYVESDDDSDTPLVADDLPHAQVRNTPTPTPPQAQTKTRRGKRTVLPSNDEEVVTPESSSSHVTPSVQQPVPTQMYPAAAPGQMYPTPTQRFPTPTQPQGVVPVGLFKTTVSVALPGEAQSAARDTADECILPDDDDIRIVSDAPAPATPAPHALPPLASIPGSHITPPTMVPLSKLQQPAQPTIPPRRNAKPIVLKMVRSAANPQSVQTCQAGPAPLQYRLVTSEAQQMPILVPASTASNHAPQMTGSTICLDSDDEDAPSAPVAVSQPAPFPVSQPTPYPVSQPAPYPVSQPAPYPVSQPAPYPVSQPTPYPVSQPSPFPTAISMASNTYNPTLSYTPIASKQATAARPVKLKLTKVDPSKFVLTKKQPVSPAQPTLTPNIVKDPPVRYIVIPKSQVPQMYPPLVPLPTDQTPHQPTVQMNPDGSYSYTLQTMHAPAVSMPSNSDVSYAENQVSQNVFTHTQSKQTPTPTATVASAPVASATVGSGKKAAQKEVKTSSTPTMTIDTGRISRHSLERRNEETVHTTAKKPTPVKPAAVERQSTPAKPVAPAKPTTPAKPAQRQRSVSSSSESDSDVSNDDPLSILKDVVHIQADSYESRTPVKETSGTNSKTVAASQKSDAARPSLASAAKTQPQKDLKKAPATSASAAKSVNKSRMFVDSVDLTFNDDDADKVETTAPKPASKPTQQTAKPQPAASKPTQPAAKPQAGASKPTQPAAKTQAGASKPTQPAAKAQPGASKSQTAASKPPTLANKTQITVTKTASKTQASVSKPAPGKAAQPATKTSLNATKTVQSTSKTINKTVQPTSNKNLSSSNQTAAKKRPAPGDAVPPKKKKTDHLMTLKDFNLDDIDDIIELD